MQLPVRMPARPAGPAKRNAEVKETVQGISTAGCCGATVCVNLPVVGQVCHCAGVESPFC